jgi:hypothetical protein
MDRFTTEELENALQIVSSTILKCENMLPKFAPGCSQHTLLHNRLQALTISKSLIVNDNGADGFTKEELTKALLPLSSIISKCEKAQMNFAEGTALHTKFQNMVKAMMIARSLVSLEISKRD